MVYLHPLAFLLGYEGVALLRALKGEHDRAFVEARFTEITELLDAHAAAPGVEADIVSTVDGYGVWSQTYDLPGNGIFAFEEAVVRPVIESLPRGVALDAACGTGRNTAWLVEQGHTTIGVDSSSGMLAHARAKVPAADFRPGDLHQLPVDDDEVDLVLCSLALTHLPDLRPIVAEFARVLRPGGRAVIADTHHENNWLLGAGPKVRFPDGRIGALPWYRHLASDYINAALPVGLRVRGCEEPRFSATAVKPMETEPVTEWPWNLFGGARDAVEATFRDVPVMIIWTFEKGAEQ
jgi:ubiquinone/menaquinone biosynthesis C-methylase UbiE